MPDDANGPAGLGQLDGGSINNLPEQAEASLTQREPALLNLIQSDFPLEKRPYAVLGQRLGLSEEEAFALTRGLREKKIIRRLGANFNSASLGFSSTLCAAKVPAEKLEFFIAEVNKLPGVTHNYLRDHAYNVWFTCIAPSMEAIRADLRSLEKKTGLAVLNLPAERLYKIKVNFKIPD